MFLFGCNCHVVCGHQEVLVEHRLGGCPIAVEQVNKPVVTGPEEGFQREVQVFVTGMFTMFVLLPTELLKFHHKISKTLS